MSLSRFGFSLPCFSRLLARSLCLSRLSVGKRGRKQALRMRAHYPALLLLQCVNLLLRELFSTYTVDCTLLLTSNLFLLLYCSACLFSLNAIYALKHVLEHVTSNTNLEQCLNEAWDPQNFFLLAAVNEYGMARKYVMVYLF